MADERISILVEAIDKASGVLGGIGGALSSLGSVALGVAAGGIAAFGAALVSGVGDAKESALLYAATEQVITSMGNSAGVSADHVVELASSLSDAAGKSLFGDDQIQASTNMLLTFGNIKGETLDLATALTVDMGQALKSTPEKMSVMVGKLLNSADAMSAAQRMGVSFTDEQLKLGKAMFESGNIAGYQKLVLGELNKEFGGQAAAAANATGGWSQFTGRLGEAKEALGAAVLPLLNMLAGVLNSRVMPAIEAGAHAFGSLIQYFQAVAEDGDTLNDFLADLPGFLRAPVKFIGDLATAFGDLSSGGIGVFADDIREMTGIDIMPVATALSAVASVVGAAFSDGGARGVLQLFIDKLAQVSPGFAILKGVVEAALPPIKDIVLSVFGIISGFITEHGAKIQADLTSAWQAIQGLINAVLPPIQSIVGSVFGAIATFLHAHGDDIKAFLGQTWDQIAEIVKVATALIQAIIVPIFTFIAGFLTAHGAAIQRILGNTWDAIKALIDAALTLIRGVLTAALQLIQGDWSGAWSTIQTMSARIVQDLYDLIVHGLNLIATFFGTSLEGLKKTWTGNWNALVEIVGKIDWMGIGLSVIDGITGGVISRAGKLVDQVVKAVKDALQAAKRALGISSPSRVFYEEIGLPMMEGAIKGIKDKEGVFSAALEHAFGAGGVLGSLGNAAAEMMRARGGFSDDFIKQQTDAIKSSEQQLSFLQQQAKLVDLIKDNGLDAKAILGDIKLGLNADPAALLEAMKNALSGLVQKTGEKFGVTPFASGVRNFSGGMALVGERGPELVALPRGSNVYSNSDTRQMGSANITVNVYSAPGQNVEQLAELVIKKITGTIALRRT